MGNNAQPTVGHWQDETTGVLRPAVEAYLKGEKLTGPQIMAMRAYIRQWMKAPFVNVTDLRARIDDIETQKDLERWFDDALELGIDPL